MLLSELVSCDISHASSWYALTHKNSLNSTHNSNNDDNSDDNYNNDDNSII